MSSEDQHQSGTELEQQPGSELAVAEADPVADPGLEPHQPRITDLDPAEANRAERQIASLFGLAGLLSLGFCVAYFAIPEHEIIRLGPLNTNANNLALGTSLGLALLLIGVGAVLWAKKLMVDTEIVEERHAVSSSEEDRAAALQEFNTGAEDSGFGRRKLLRRSLLGTMAVLGLPMIVALRDLGPLPGRKLYTTIWAPGIRVVNDVTLRPIKPEDMVIGQLVNAAPENLQKIREENHAEYLNERAKAAVILVRIRPDEIRPGPNRDNWDVNGILCYSKICTHVGCPISLYEQTTHHVLCPCHQSTFDLADSARVMFGPAARPLPQLPLTVDSEGYLVAQDGFDEPVGASFFERG